MPTTQTTRSRPRRLRFPSLALAALAAGPGAALVLAAALVSISLSGCGAGKEAQAQAATEKRPGEENRERSRIVHKKLKRIERALRKLPQVRPDQKLAYEQIRSRYAFVKINYESKVKARLGDVPDRLYVSTMDALREIDRQIKRFPR